MGEGTYNVVQWKNSGLQWTDGVVRLIDGCIDSAHWGQSRRSVVNPEGYPW